MLNFFYESLDTLRDVKKPTKKDVTRMTVAVLVVIIISWILFMLIDGLFNIVYNDWIYNILMSIFK